MSQVVGNPNFQYTGTYAYGLGHFKGRLNPNSFSDPATYGRVTVNSVEVGSTFQLAGVGLFQKTATDPTGNTSGTWSQVTIP